MRILTLHSEGSMDLPEGVKNYSYKKISYNKKDDSYLYEFKYLSSGLKLVLVMSSSEAFWLQSGGKYLDKFEKALDRAFAIYMKNMEYMFKKGKIVND